MQILFTLWCHAVRAIRTEDQDVANMWLHCANGRGCTDEVVRLQGRDDHQHKVMKRKQRINLNKPRIVDGGKLPYTRRYLHMISNAIKRGAPPKLSIKSKERLSWKLVVGREDDHFWLGESSMEKEVNMLKTENERLRTALDRRAKENTKLRNEVDRLQVKCNHCILQMIQIKTRSKPSMKDG